MTIAEQIYQHALNLPAPKAREVLDFIEFLEAKGKAGPSEQVPVPPQTRKPGSAQGKIWMAEDFNITIDDV